MSTYPSFMSSANAADVPSRKTAATRNCVTRDIFISIRKCRLLNTDQKKFPIVNSKTIGCSPGRVLNGMPHSKRSGPIGENQRNPNPQLWRYAEKSSGPLQGFLL